MLDFLLIHLSNVKNDIIRIIKLIKKSEYSSNANFKIKEARLVIRNENITDKNFNKKYLNLVVEPERKREKKKKSGKI